MTKTIYVGNLEWATTEKELMELFEPFGKVSAAKIIKDHHTNKSKGYGFIEMENADEAVDELNGKDLRGRALKINNIPVFILASYQYITLTTP